MLPNELTLIYRWMDKVSKLEAFYKRYLLKEKQATTWAVLNQSRIAANV